MAASSTHWLVVMLSLTMVAWVTASTMASTTLPNDNEVARVDDDCDLNYDDCHLYQDKFDVEVH